MFAWVGWALVGLPILAAVLYAVGAADIVIGLAMLIASGAVYLKTWQRYVRPAQGGEPTDRA
jgi:hypothetical protein